MYMSEPIVANKTTITPNMANSGGIPELGEKQNVNIKPSPIPPSNITRIVVTTLSGILTQHLRGQITEALIKVDYIKGNYYKQPNANNTIIKACPRGASAPLSFFFPLPFQGRGTQGVGCK